MMRWQQRPELTPREPWSWDGPMEVRSVPELVRMGLGGAEFACLPNCTVSDITLIP